MSKPSLKLGWLFLVLLLIGCGGTPAASSITTVFPDASVIPGWTPTGEAEVFNGENLFDLVNGQADAFFAYAFEQVAVRRYENAEAARLDVEVWRVATPADAYGLFRASFSGTAVAMGNDGDSDPGRRLAFWQDRFYVRVRARQTLPDAELRAFAEAVSAALPSGGERPALLKRLPRDGLVENSDLFVHQELSIQGELWLGGENLLKLGPETDGVLARYNLGGAEAYLLLVEYPDAGQASTGLEALQASSVGDLVTAQVQGNLLGAVFGPADKAAAEVLLKAALSQP